MNVIADGLVISGTVSCEGCGKPIAKTKPNIDSSQPGDYACITCGKTAAQSRTVLEHWQAIAADGTKTSVVTCGADACKRTSAEFAEMLEAKRPLQVGDYVRWRHSSGNEHTWVDGELLELGETAKIKVENRGPGCVTCLSTDWFGHKLGQLSRIPRPADQQPILDIIARIDADARNYYAEHGSLPRFAYARVAVARSTGGWTAGSGSSPTVAVNFPQQSGEEVSARVAERAREEIYRLQVERMRDEVFSEPYREPDPLDVMYDGVALGQLLSRDQLSREERGGLIPRDSEFTSAQRAAVSAHWSAQLRANVAASVAADKARRVSVVCDSGEADE